MTEIPDGILIAAAIACACITIITYNIGYVSGWHKGREGGYEQGVKDATGRGEVAGIQRAIDALEKRMEEASIEELLARRRQDNEEGTRLAAYQESLGEVAHLLVFEKRKAEGEKA